MESTHIQLLDSHIQSYQCGQFQNKILLFLIFFLQTLFLTAISKAESRYKVSLAIIQNISLLMALLENQQQRNLLKQIQAVYDTDQRCLSPKMHPHPNAVVNPQECKQKSELCKQFMEFGECPYQNRCKFAHGSHQLLKNQQANNKYKTKHCENFGKKWFCTYGKRCNFIHKKGCEKKQGRRKSRSVELSMIKGCTKQGSRLLELLSSSDRV